MSANTIPDHDPTQAVGRGSDVIAQALNEAPKLREVISFSIRPEVQGFFEARTYSVQYVVGSRRPPLCDH